MKFKQLTKIAAIGTLGSTFCILASCKDAAEVASTMSDKVEQAATTNDAATVPVFIVTVSGKGWGVGAKTSSVLIAQTGVKKVKLSGLRATVYTEDGTTLNEEEIKKQLTAEGLGLVSINTEELSTPVAAYLIKAKGTGGWSDKAEKVRVALEKIDSVSSAFVNAEIELYLDKEVELDVEEIKSAIASGDCQFIEMEKLDSPTL